MLSQFHVQAADLVQLNAENWDEFAPQGKEVDCIYGDYVLRNDVIVAVIGEPKEGRNANMTVRNVGGAVIDLTRRDHSNDQLSAFYPGRGGTGAGPCRSPNDGRWRRDFASAS